MKYNDLVTVVIPVYNVEKYIEKSLQSIINQTYKNLEIIIVNDGSKDKSIEICNSIASHDERIKIISQKNMGLSAARNAGLDSASGKYICFIDSDDYVSENFVFELLNDIKINDSDISVCDFYYVNEQGEKWENGKVKENKIYSNIEAIKDIFVLNQNTEVMTWNKLYKTNIFKDNDIKFPVGKINEDNFTTYKLYYYSKRISLVNKKLYYYLQRKNSIMNSEFNLKKLDILESIEQVKTFFENKIEFTKEIEYYEMQLNINVLNTMIKQGFSGKEKESIIKKIKQDKKKYLKSEYISKRYSLMLRFIFGKGTIYSIIIKFLNDIRSNKIKS